MDIIQKDVRDQIVEIDGSYGEGGGQIIRNAVTYACLLRRKIDVVNIRANRPNPGLASQHLESILAILRISGGTTTKAPKKQATEFDLDGSTIPSSSNGVNTTVDLVTAGSCTLCIQCILPYLLCLKTPSNVRVIGGTHVMKSPSFDYLKKVFLPIFNELIGNDVKATLRNPGYYPRGGGRIEIEVNPTLGKFKPVNLIERGSMKNIEAILNITPKMKGKIPQFRNLISADTRDIEIREVSFASIEYFLQFENSYAGFSYLVEGRNPDPNNLIRGIEKVQQELKAFLNSSATVDGYMQDQLIIYMALAKLTDSSKASQIRTGPLSDHTTSAIHVSQLFAPGNLFSVTENEDKSVDVIL